MTDASAVVSFTAMADGTAADYVHFLTAVTSIRRPTPRPSP
ncbi:MAG: hypothetical protein R2706_05565 [Acidimicrobiales bacterium]